MTRAPWGWSSANDRFPARAAGAKPGDPISSAATGLRRRLTRSLSAMLPSVVYEIPEQVGELVHGQGMAALTSGVATAMAASICAQVRDSAA